MKSITSSILIAVGLAAASCGAGNYAANGNGGYVNSIYYTSDADNSPSVLAHNGTDIRQLQSRTTDALASGGTRTTLHIGDGSKSDTVYVGGRNVVNIDYEPNVTYALLDDDESYEERLRKFDSPSYTVNINIDTWDYRWRNPFWGFNNGWYRPYGITWGTGWYNPYWGTYYTWRPGWGWTWGFGWGYYDPWYSWYDPWFDWGWGWRPPHRPHWGWNPPHFRNWMDVYYGSRNNTGPRGNRNTGRNGFSSRNVAGIRNSSPAGSRPSIGVAGNGAAMNPAGKPQGSDYRKKPTMDQIRGNSSTARPSHSVGTGNNTPVRGTGPATRPNPSARPGQTSRPNSATRQGGSSVGIGTGAAGRANSTSATRTGSSLSSGSGAVYSNGAANTGYKRQPAASNGSLRSGGTTYRPSANKSGSAAKPVTAKSSVSRSSSSDSRSSVSSANRSNNSNNSNNSGSSTVSRSGGSYSGGRSSGGSGSSGSRSGGSTTRR